MARKHGEIRKASPTNPVIIDTSQGRIMVYRLGNGKLGVRHPPGVRVLKTVDKRLRKDSNPP